MLYWLYIYIVGGVEGGTTGEDERSGGHGAEPEAAGEAAGGAGRQRECSGWLIT